MEFQIDDETKETITEKPFDWYMNLRLRGNHELTVTAYDSAGNKELQTLDMRIFNLFGRN